MNFYPIGAQYYDVIGKGNLNGMADEIIYVSQKYEEQLKEAEARRFRTNNKLREYKRIKRATKSTRVTEIMKVIMEYIRKNPGVQKGDIMFGALKYKLISPSSLGHSLKCLIDQELVITDGKITKRKFYISEKKNEQN